MSCRNGSTHTAVLLRIKKFQGSNVWCETVCRHFGFCGFVYAFHKYHRIKLSTIRKRVIIFTLFPVHYEPITLLIKATQSDLINILSSKNKLSSSFCVLHRQSVKYYHKTIMVPFSILTCISKRQLSIRGENGVYYSQVRQIGPILRI